MKRLLIILTAATMLMSCREVVFEDRTECPSFLFFDIKNYNKFENYEKVFTSVYSHPKGDLIEETEVTAREIQDKEFYYIVRGTPAVKGYGLIGYDKLIQNGQEWTVPIGQDYVPLFRYSYQETVQEESFIIPVEFVKDYAKVSVQFIGMDTFSSAGGRFPFDIVVRGNTTGINALTGVPVRGSYEFKPQETTIGHFEFTLPRQADHNLTLEMYGREGVYERTGFTDSYDLYDILYKIGGITWTEKNLPDLNIEIDYQETTVTVNVCAWDYVELNYEH